MGKCSINLDEVLKIEEDQERDILVGLRLMHEDIELYKKDYKEKIDNEYKIKILQKKNLELEQFNYMASHDLKEPIRTIKNYAQLIQRNSNNLSSDQSQSHLNTIIESSTRMYNLIEGLLLYSTTGNELDIVKVNLGVLVEEIMLDLGEIIRENDVTIHAQSQDFIFADRICLRTILQNLIVNAIKYKRPDKSPIIEIKVIQSQDRYEITVADNGIGISEKYSEIIFDLLKRLHNHDTVEGAGIGLSLCKKLVHLHNGEIWVDSKVDEGSAFTFTISKNLNPSS